jgi:hypothetical protein
VGCPCELRDYLIWRRRDRAIRQDGELLFSRRCPDQTFALSVAGALKQDHLKVMGLKDVKRGRARRIAHTFLWKSARALGAMPAD